MRVLSLSIVGKGSHTCMYTQVSPHADTNIYTNSIPTYKNTYIYALWKLFFTSFQMCFLIFFSFFCYVKTSKRKLAHTLRSWQQLTTFFLLSFENISSRTKIRQHDQTCPESPHSWNSVCALTIRTLHQKNNIIQVDYK